MSLQSLDSWWRHRQAQEDFFRRRKSWARQLMSSHGLNKPGDSLRAEFEGFKFSIVVGPRGGVKIYPKSVFGDFR